MENKKKIFNIIYISVFILYLIRPLCFDVKIYLSAAYQATLIKGFPNNIFMAWEHKFIINRFIFYIIYLIANMVVSSNKIILFEIMVKLIYGILAITIIKVFLKASENFFKKYNINKSITFFILYFAIFTAGSYYELQTEMTTLLILLLAISFALKYKLFDKIIAAWIISLLFWFKGVTLLYSVLVLAVMLLDKQNYKEITFTIIWSFIFLLIEILLIYCFRPLEIEKMFLATQYIVQKIDFEKIISYFIFCNYYNKYLCIGFSALIINSVNNIKRKNIKLLILEVFIWIVLSVGVIIQKMQFFYQIGLLMPAFIFSIFIYYQINQSAKKSKKLFLSICIILVIINALTELVSNYECIKETCIAEQNVKILEEQIPDLKNTEVLYIGNGLSSYYIKGKSYIDYTTTIFLCNYNKIYLNNEYIQKLKLEIKNYQGKYIIIDENEFIIKYRLSEDIIKFIKENYHYYKSTGISIYEHDDKYKSVIYERNMKNNNDY